MSHKGKIICKVSQWQLFVAGPDVSALYSVQLYTVFDAKRTTECIEIPGVSERWQFSLEKRG